MDINLFKKDINQAAKGIILNNFLLYFVVVLLILKIFAAGAYFNLPKNIFFADITKTDLLNLVNRERELAGVDNLSENYILDQAAYLKAEDMVKNQYFSHTSPSGITPWHWFSKAGYNYESAGENLAIGFYDSKEAVVAWLASPSHRQNLLNPAYKEVGASVQSGFGNNNAIIVVQFFASRKAEAKVAETPKEPEQPGPQFPVILGATESPKNNDIYFKTLNYILYDSESLLENIIFGASLVAIGVVMSAMFFSEAPLSKKLIFRSFVILAILGLAYVIKGENIIPVIPHKIII